MIMRSSISYFLFKCLVSSDFMVSLTLVEAISLTKYLMSATINTQTSKLIDFIQSMFSSMEHVVLFYVLNINLLLAQL